VNENEYFSAQVARCVWQAGRGHGGRPSLDSLRKVEIVFRLTYKKGEQQPR